MNKRHRVESGLSPFLIYSTKLKFIFNRIYYEKTPFLSGVTCVLNQFSAK